MVPAHLYCAACGAANPAQSTYCFACGHPLAGVTGLLSPNHLLKQHYRILSKVGQGGFGAVYKAEDIQLGNRLVAVKEMSQYNLSPQKLKETVDTFKREAHMLAGLQHDTIPLFV